MAHCLHVALQQMLVWVADCQELCESLTLVSVLRDTAQHLDIALMGSNTGTCPEPTLLLVFAALLILLTLAYFVLFLAFLCQSVVQTQQLPYRSV